ncbi:hypothetical protein TRFO_18830 [Tritrichomonas foetus]|uniref:Ubiquitin-like domain-containing protein n=1 Tax=Tritrichomonas foetus TaxID=1144522 RepID=A0A1J4KP64_9EUKA|nr:hypothetical protein TRFO_18830 [Tritrichomonas foetus]|eukprot:OHT11588.1 hypothetical protein TRFO_18830 [Tritrichomonas foetus]
MFTIRVKFQKKYEFKYYMRKGGFTASDLKSFFCRDENSPFKLQSKHHLIIQPIEIEETNISFFKKGKKEKNELPDDYEFSKDISLTAKLSRNIAFYPFYLDLTGHRETIYVLIPEGTKVISIRNLFQEKLQLNPIKICCSYSSKKSEIMAVNTLFSIYNAVKKYHIILPDHSNFSFIVSPDTVPLFDLTLSCKIPRTIYARVADEINKRFSLLTHLTSENIELYNSQNNELLKKGDQLKETKDPILVKIVNAQIPKSPSYFFLFPDSPIPRSFELERDFTVGDFINKKCQNFKYKGTSLLLNGKKLHKKAKFSELNITMANLIIVMEKVTKITLNIKIANKKAQKMKFRNCYQISELYEKVRDYIGSRPFTIKYQDQVLENEKTCRDYGIGDGSEITVNYTLSRSANNSSTNILDYVDEDSGSYIEKPHEGGTVIFSVQGKKQLSHVFGSKELVKSARAFIAKTLGIKDVSNIDLLLNGRYLNDSMKLSVLPLSNIRPIVVVVKDDNKPIALRTAAGLLKNMKMINIVFLYENTGEEYNLTFLPNPTVADAIEKIEIETDIPKDQIEITFDDCICSDMSSKLQDIQKLKEEENFFFRNKSLFQSTEESVLSVFKLYSGRALRKLSLTKDPNVSEMFCLTNLDSLNDSKSDFFEQKS